MITKIGTAMLEVLQENDCTTVMWGDCSLLDGAFSRSGSRAKVRHPLDRWQYVLDSLSQDERFEKNYISLDLFVGKSYQNREVRWFKLKQEECQRPGAGRKREYRVK